MQLQTQGFTDPEIRQVLSHNILVPVQPLV